jgi:hypothetical protein
MTAPGAIRAIRDHGTVTLSFRLARRNREFKYFTS